MAGDELERTKDRLDREFLGRGGIHGVGLRRSRQAVAVYVSPEPAPDRERTLAQLRREAAPFNVIVIEDEPPMMAG